MAERRQVDKWRWRPGGGRSLPWGRQDAGTTKTHSTSMKPSREIPPLGTGRRNQDQADRALEIWACRLMLL
jgi:hypothetical protein